MSELVKYRFEGSEMIFECAFCNEELDRYPVTEKSRNQFLPRWNALIKKHLDDNHVAERDAVIGWEHYEATEQIKRDLGKWFPRLSK